MLRGLPVDIFIALVSALPPSTWNLIGSGARYAKEVLDFEFDEPSAKALTEYKTVTVLAPKVIDKVRGCCTFCAHILQTEYSLYALRALSDQAEMLSTVAKSLEDLLCSQHPGEKTAGTEPTTAAPRIADDRQRREAIGIMSFQAASIAIEPAIDQEMGGPSPIPSAVTSYGLEAESAPWVANDDAMEYTDGSQFLPDGWNVADTDWRIQEEV